MEIVYKVLKVGKFGLVSCVETALSQYYQPGYWIEPYVKGTGLFCFPDKTDAGKWGERNWGHVIYEAEATDVKPVKQVSGRLRSRAHLECAWGLNRDVYPEFMDAPMGATTCSGMRLIKPVWIFDDYRHKGV